MGWKLLFRFTQVQDKKAVLISQYLTSFFFFYTQYIADRLSCAFIKAFNGREASNIFYWHLPSFFLMH